MDLFDLGIAFDGGAPQIVGYNLDLTCTDSDASTSCAPGPGGMVQKDAPTPPGMDNVGSMLIALPGESSPFSPANIYSALRMGKFGALISVSFYNGELDDDSVKVNFFPAIGLKNGALPNFDSADLWQTDDNYDIGGGTSKLQSNGYVAGGRLVVKFDEVAFDVPVGDDNSLLHLHLVDAVLSAKLEKDDAGPAYRLTDGVIGGRWKLAEMLGAIGTIGNGNGGAVCTDGVYGPIVKAAICQSADLAPAAAADRTGATCGAVSVGCRFTAYYVADRDAQKHRAPTTPRTCPPDYTQCQ